MKRLFCGVLCLAVLFCITACTKKGEHASSTEPAGDTVATQVYGNNIVTEYVNPDEIAVVTESVAYTASQGETTTAPRSDESTTAKVTTSTLAPSVSKPTRPEKVTSHEPSTTMVHTVATTVLQVKPAGSETTIVCLHKNTVIKNKINATVEYDGYTGDTHCGDCGVLLQKGEKVEFKEEGVSAGMVQYPCPDGSTITVPVGTNVFDYTMKKANKSASHDFYELEKEIVALFNEERARLGITSAKWNEDAYYYVKTRAVETQMLFSHTRPGGDDFSGVYKDEGIVLCAMAENIVDMTVQEGEDIARKIFDAVMNSPPHKATALDSRFNQISVALTFYDGQYYFCQHMYENVVH